MQLDHAWWSGSLLEVNMANLIILWSSSTTLVDRGKAEFGDWDHDDMLDYCYSCCWTIWGWLGCCNWRRYYLWWCFMMLIWTDVFVFCWSVGRVSLPLYMWHMMCFYCCVLSLCVCVCLVMQWRVSRLYAKANFVVARFPPSSLPALLSEQRLLPSFLLSEASLRPCCSAMDRCHMVAIECFGGCITD